MRTALLTHGLVDDLHLMVGSRVMGGGMPVFSAPPDLTLLGARRFDGSDNVLLRYAAASR